MLMAYTDGHEKGRDRGVRDEGARRDRATRHGCTGGCMGRDRRIVRSTTNNARVLTLEY